MPGSTSHKLCRRWGDSGKIVFEFVESDAEECLNDLEESSDEEEDEPPKASPGDHETSEEDDSEPEPIDVFVQGLKAAYDARKALPTKTSTRKKIYDNPLQVVNLFTPIEELNILPTAEPEYLEVEMTLDTGATVHAMDILDLPGFTIQESPGSRVGQKFQAAGGKLIANEGQVMINMLAPGMTTELVCNVQIAKVTRPLLSVTKMTESGKVTVLCDKDKALVLDEKKQTVAVFEKSGGLYTAMMRIRNPRFQPFGRPAR